MRALIKFFTYASLSRNPISQVLMKRPGRFVELQATIEAVELSWCKKLTIPILDATGVRGNRLELCGFWNTVDLRALAGLV